MSIPGLSRVGLVTTWLRSPWGYAVHGPVHRARHRLRLLSLLVVLSAVLLADLAAAQTRGASAPAPIDSAATQQELDDCGTDAACPMDLSEPAPEAEPAAGAGSRRATLLFFWGVGCPHCEDAKPFVERLDRERPRLSVESIEVRKDPAGRQRFIETMKRLGVQAGGVPTFVVGDRYVVGYLKGVTDKQVTDMVDQALGESQGAALEQPAAREVTLPLLGTVNPSAMSLPIFTLTVGLLDGLNPCAMWVLLVLLGILAHVRSTKRLLLVGGTFVVMSGVVYFAFMTAWLSLFQLVGLSRLITRVLGVVVLVMGLINLKELVWFKKGPSLTIPDRVKPGLYRRMRGVANAVSLPATFVGIAALAFFVNLIELACTLGLPAVYTRVLSLREQLSTLERYAYLALYNVAYVVPLALIVIIYTVTLRRLALGERGAKLLKGFSGALLVVFGSLFLLAPGVLV